MSPCAPWEMGRQAEIYPAKRKISLSLREHVSTPWLRPTPGGWFGAGLRGGGLSERGKKCVVDGGCSGSRVWGIQEGQLEGRMPEGWVRVGIPAWLLADQASGSVLARVQRVRWLPLEPGLGWACLWLTFLGSGCEHPNRMDEETDALPGSRCQVTPSQELALWPLVPPLPQLPHPSFRQPNCVTPDRLAPLSPGG